jgi:DNA-binding beta-propeller fold protein YncE
MNCNRRASAGDPHLTGIATLVLASTLAVGCGGGGAGTPDAGGPDPMRDVLLVGNGYAGTVSFLDGHTFENLGSLNVIPDLQQRLTALYLNPITAVAYTVIKEEQKVKHYEPGDGDRFLDDLFVSPDGRTLYVSRSNLGDVAAFDLSTSSHEMLWRTDVSGLKADHATISPDGKRLIVSATTVDKADVIDAQTGAIVHSFPTGNYPHQNDYSANGERIYNASIGQVGLPYAERADKGARQLTVVDANTLEVVKIYPFDAGIRPAVITADEKIMYAQLSHLNGVVKFDLITGTMIKVLEQPFSAFAMATYPHPDEYPHDSAHHGLAMSGDGTRLCDAGTIDHTVAIVLTDSLTVERMIDVGLVPYWATTSVDGKHCLVSMSGDNEITVINYQTGQIVKQVPVGKFPQRNRLGRVPESVLRWLSPSPG